jgi:hypothetical protein
MKDQTPSLPIEDVREEAHEILAALDASRQLRPRKLRPDCGFYKGLAVPPLLFLAICASLSLSLPATPGVPRISRSPRDRAHVARHCPRQSHRPA